MELVLVRLQALERAALRRRVALALDHLLGAYGRDLERAAKAYQTYLEVTPPLVRSPRSACFPAACPANLVVLC